ncbi:hypothetical protein SAMN06297144_0172 [Sphingomonas guangdongensis]|uniref:Uncharacterized protein n=1 Tax=Sphingomonas guangdongensis TaxID=1141890 RepID=A0A285QA16_9SPHN|nr:DUF6683 family protein [Sphingomonas guangdongensis]SOB78703.1 hypothetical protein SAMN06297144_0172 [Sphingomonas guangdongensis]
MRARSLPWLVAAIIFVGTAGTGAAQDLGGYYGGMAMGGLVTNQTNITQSAIGTRGEQDAAEAAQPSEAETAPPLRYTPSLARRRSNLAGFVARLRAGDPQGATALEQAAASGDLIESIGADLARYGLRIDDVADAYSVWWVNAWLGWAGDTSDQTRAQMAAVRAQAARAVAATPSFANADEAARQEFAESLLVQAALIGAATKQIETDPAMKPQLRQAMAQAGQGMGLDFAAMRLTSSGFRAVGE